jgi:hypothetical protein
MIETGAASKKLNGWYKNNVPGNANSDHYLFFDTWWALP